MPGIAQASSMPVTLLYRLALLTATSCIVVFANPAAIFMLLFVVLSSQPFVHDLANGTTRIRLDLHITHNQPPTQPRQRNVNHHPRRPSTPCPSAQSYTWRSSRAYTTANVNPERQSLSSELPSVHEPRPHNTSQFTTNPVHFAPYTSTDPLPPARPGDDVQSMFSWRADEPLPPARPDDDTASEPQLFSRRDTFTSMPPLVPTDSGDDENVLDEPLPRYERPPEYDDSRHSIS